MGTLLPLALGLILINRLDTVSVFVTLGMFYILAGAYFDTVMPAQPMKIIAAYSIAMGLTQKEIMASTLCMSAFLLFVGLTGLIEPIGRHTPKSVIKGIQLSVGVMLIVKGLTFVLGSNIVLGSLGLFAALFFLKNEKVPAAIVLVLGGILAGLLTGKPFDTSILTIGITLPRFFPYGIPSYSDFLAVVAVVVLPQVPTTVGNAVISVSDLSSSYFGDSGRKASFRGLSLSQGIANLFSFLLGGMPLCHGAGGLAAHYRFGARTPGANVMIGSIFVVLAVLFGSSLVAVFQLIPTSILGVLLIFSGVQLGAMVRDLKGRSELLVAFLVLAMSLITNLGVAFVCGVVAVFLLRPKAV